MRIVNYFCLAISTTLFTGFIPSLIRRPGKGSGTIGALVALAVQLMMLNSSWQTMLALVLASFVVGWIVVGPAERLLLELSGPRRRHTGEVVSSDFNETNIDEFHGQMIAGLPIWLFDKAENDAWWLLIVSFVLFRFYDAAKPFPIDALESATKGTGFGIMIDDTVAGLMSGAIMLGFIALYVYGATFSSSIFQ